MEQSATATLASRTIGEGITRRGASPGRIATVDSLRTHLQWAIELEHFTLPPYLCALYSLDPARNSEAAEVIGSVLVEEMLHMTLAANLLNAVGGRPMMDTPRLLPGYPACLPHSNGSFEVPLLPFGLPALEVFLKIERPAPVNAAPESDRYETIGQFYRAIELGLRELSTEQGESRIFCGDPARQVTGEMFTGNPLSPITDLASALQALSRIVEQGEGADHLQVWDGDHEMFHPERDEVAHYYRFLELKIGRRFRRGDTPTSGPTGDRIQIDWEAVAPMRPNPRTVDHDPEGPIHAAQQEFNRSYCSLLKGLDGVFDGNPKQLSSAIGTMYGLKTKARALGQLPTEDGSTTAGPSFEYVPPERRARPARIDPTL
jgi:hypothetical protein